VQVLNLAPDGLQCLAQGLLSDEQVWLDMIEMRNLLSHVYDEHEISRILTELERYLAAFDSILAQLRKTLPDDGARVELS
jgi:nucleotidyltransferase substrate binding protein (TIGR01987 family)